MRGKAHTFIVLSLELNTSCGSQTFRKYSSLFLMGQDESVSQEKEE